MKPWKIFTIVLGFISGISTLQAQPDYPTAHWTPPSCVKWYTSGNARQFCVIHDMEGYYESSISYLNRCDTDAGGNFNVAASVYYLVNGLQNGSDAQGHSENDPGDAPIGDITQSVRESNYAWHARCWNTWMFGTEHEGFVSNPTWYTEGMYQASADLQRYLCDKYGIPKDRNHIVGHDEKKTAAWVAWMSTNFPAIDATCNTHTDPGVFWDWDHFIALINGKPGISTQPWSRLVEPGSNVTFNVSATGTEPLFYQWQKNGTDLAGETSTNFSLANVQPSDAGGFSVVVTNVEGAITSRVAQLSVSPQWVPAFADDFETNSAARWKLFWRAGNGVSDFTTNWAFDYSATEYVASGVTNFIPSAPNSAGTTHGLKITVNKNDTVAATAGVSVYPKNSFFTNDYVLRFDMWINYNGGPGGGTGSTEYGTFGLNHTGTEINWTTAATTSDGLWFAVDGEGGSGGSDYRAYVGNGAAAPTQLSFANSGLAASGAGTANFADPFYRSLFPSPAFESAGVPGKHWVQGEVSQIKNVITWQLDGVVVAQRTINSAYTNGNVMIGYMDPFTSIANPLEDNFVIFDNVRVLISAAARAFENVVIQPRHSSAIVKWTSAALTTSQIEYGVAPGFGNLSPWETTPQTNHALLLNGLIPGATYVFRIHSLLLGDEVTSGQFTFSPGTDLIVDNPDAHYSGTWTLGTSSPDKYGDYYQSASATTAPTPSAMANYIPTLPTPGKYDVSIWYPQGANRTTNAQVTVFYADGVLAKGVNQTAGGGAWQPLGLALNFAAGTGGFVGIGNNTSDGNASKVVMADAIRWSYTVAQDIPTDGTVPSWWSEYYFGSDVDASLDTDGDGYSTYAEYVLATDPTDADSRLTVSAQPMTGGVQVVFAPWEGGRTYELQSRTNPSSGIWTTLPLLPTVTNGQGIFSVTNLTQSGAQLYRVSVRLTP